MDTNVPLVANGVSDAGPDCIIACTRAISDLMASGHIVVDTGWSIVEEYRHQLSPSGQPGPGDAFLKWLLTNLRNPKRCTQVTLTPLPDDQGDYREFPEELRTIGFDHSDRKFVAVALTDTGSPVILQGTDSKWWGWRDSLERAGVDVKFLCATKIAAKHTEKMAER